MLHDIFRERMPHVVHEWLISTIGSLTCHGLDTLCEWMYYRVPFHACCFVSFVNPNSEGLGQPQVPIQLNRGIFGRGLTTQIEELLLVFFMWAHVRGSTCVTIKRPLSCGVRVTMPSRLWPGIVVYYWDLER